MAKYSWHLSWTNKKGVRFDRSVLVVPPRSHPNSPRTVLVINNLQRPTYKSPEPCIYLEIHWSIMTRPENFHLNYLKKKKIHILNLQTINQPLNLSEPSWAHNWKPPETKLSRGAKTRTTSSPALSLIAVGRHWITWNTCPNGNSVFLKAPFPYSGHFCLFDAVVVSI